MLAHPLPDGRTAVLSRDLATTAASVDAFHPGDGESWELLAADWRRLSDGLVGSLFTPFPPVSSGARLVRTLDRQLASIAEEVTVATNNMGRAESELAEKKVVLRHRVVDIYKRGPLYTTEALLSAQSFGELVARYKYLHMLALRDRALVRRVEAQETELTALRADLARLRPGASA